MKSTKNYHTMCERLISLKAYQFLEGVVYWCDSQSVNKKVLSKKKEYTSDFNLLIFFNIFNTSNTK